MLGLQLPVNGVPILLPSVDPDPWNEPVNKVAIMRACCEIPRDILVRSRKEGVKNNSPVAACASV